MRRHPTWSQTNTSGRLVSRSSRQSRRVLARFVCASLMFNLMLLPGSDQPLSWARGGLVGAVTAAAQKAVARLRQVYLIVTPIPPILIPLWLPSSTQAPPDESLAERAARVTALRPSPAKFVGYERQTVTFSALPVDYAERTVQGVRVWFESSDESVASVDESGNAKLVSPGLAWITCRAGSAQARIPVLVKQGDRPVQTDGEWLADQASLRADGTTTGGSGGSASVLEKLTNALAPTVYAQQGSSSDFGYDEQWSEPRNLVGSPRNRAIEPTIIGSVLPEGSDFSFAVPIVSLPGRGLDLNLALHYNSRVWTRRGCWVAFDPINGYPGPGFSLGFDPPGHNSGYNASGGER